ncbi:pimeloyl-ACP methyl ester carboxylesterase [Kibdelosporangium banguiense]|uniref:Pimeloyl-ACP methyl ester carboxylesterase n=1 Tax=Kibdelosporangium banguiense TaxID=1365924 RepID=A0ABS4TT38_9PSEU|nr:alpha/beta hydrolase [Kibdelosporangium banguiense]MBP2327573.1 pimeloyl-ACP methyl ester carboxylesterase [Kibdelosporangium banguiense]
MEAAQEFSARRSLLLAVGVVVALIAGVVPAFPTPAASSAVPIPERYLTQRIEWKSCFPQGPPSGLPPGSERLECGSFAAPRNWNRPEDKIDVVIAVSRLRPASGAEPRGSVLANPGVPGVPGRLLPLVFLQADRGRLLDNMEVVGIDVRGTGDSTNVSCGNAPSSSLDPRDRSAANLDLILDTMRLLARSCQTHSGELGRYITTEQTVRDHDLLRHLLGQEKISWIGYSAGTWLGAYYATYFPHRVDKFVLDSNVEFTTGWQAALRWQPRGYERRFREHFLPWVATYDNVYHLGTTAEAVRQVYEQVRATLTERPAEVDIDGEVLTADAVTLDSAIIMSLYTKYLFPKLARFLRAVRAAAGTSGHAIAFGQPQQAAAQLEAAKRRPHGPPLPMQTQGQQTEDAITATMSAITCNDTPWHGDRTSLIRESERQGRRYPLPGWYSIFQQCVFWKRPNLFLPQPTGQGVPPVLMVQSTHDPAAPIEGAERAHRRFTGSRLLTVTGEGDHTIYAGGNPCVDNQVEAFLVDGVVPAGDLSCPGMPLPQPDAPPRLTNPLQALVKFLGLTGPLPK